MKSFLNGKIQLHCGDMLAVLPTLAENSIDSCVCDPPYHLSSIVKRFGDDDAAPAKVGKTGAYARASSGFMGKVWDGGDIAFQPETWAQVFRVLKPGAHLIAFGGTRTYHRMACAIEDAGFEVRDTILWLYGSGFPKSHDVSKGIDRAAGAERKVVGAHPFANRGTAQSAQAVNLSGSPERQQFIYAPATDAARQWAGFGTALKPACEPIVLARKPLSEGTVAANVLKWGTGALNIDGCRVGVREKPKITNPKRTSNTYGEIDSPGGKLLPDARWPANVIHDGSEEVLAWFPDAPGQQAAVSGNEPSNSTLHIFNGLAGRYSPREPVGDSGSAARFFYTAKADSDDRLGSKHPTVKPLDLMQYLVRLVTPPQGTVLDCFAGTGTTGEAAFREGMRAVLIEREAEYQADIRRRMGLVLGGPEERARAAIKELLKDKPIDAGPLFGGS